ncbi:MAG: phenylacetate--CoA ligase family protein [Deltaproteobacteria bacterium]|nr:phenylacetate--CoA ligase family protein [Deltaproteobacteria bacterium]
MTRIAPAARIQRDTRPQRTFRARADAHLEALRRGTDPTRIQQLASALARSPAHRARLAALGLAPRDLRSLDDLPHFPTLSRAELAEQWDAFPVVDVERELSVARSSGTTGEPVRVVRDAYDNLHMWTVLRFWLERLGIALPPRPRVVLLDALPGGLEYSVRVPLLGDGALHRLSTTRIDASERLARAKPSVIFTDPAGLHWLLGQERVPSPKLVLTSAQALAPALREALQARLGAPLLDYYATTETGPIAWACPRAPERFHVLSPDVHVESVNGELVVTRLRESVLPLLRYLPGDRGDVQQLLCPCGLAGSSIVGLSGRSACRFVRPDGVDIDAWSLAWIFKHHALRAFQLIQRERERERFTLKLDAPARDSTLEDRLRSALVAQGWTAPVLDVVLGPLATQAKPEPFVCEL